MFKRLYTLYTNSCTRIDDVRRRGMHFMSVLFNCHLPFMCQVFLLVEKVRVALKLCLLSLYVTGIDRVESVIINKNCMSGVILIGIGGSLHSSVKI
jgi:hypothetical protein